MITKEQAIEKVRKYARERNRSYSEIVQGRVNFQENIKIPYGKYDDQIRTIYTVTCEIDGYLDPITHFISVDAETGEVLFTATPHGYAEDWDEQ
jgi:hypothetical protein